jgi:hypothetical protein
VSNSCVSRQRVLSSTFEPIDPGTASLAATEALAGLRARDAR